MVRTDGVATIVFGLARKARTPAPPRRPVQAPKVRSTPRTSTPEEDRKRLLMLVLIAASGLVALAIVVGFLAFGTGGNGGAGTSSSFAQQMEDAGYAFKSYPAMKNNSNHSDVKSIDQKVTWNSDPPSSGPHYGQWALWGAYDRAVPLTMSTHNLEHGGIVLHYGPEVPPAEVEKLRDFYRDDPNAMLLAPLATAGNQIVASAWYYDEGRADDEEYLGEGKQIKGTAVDADALEAFRDEFRYKGRERIPAENLQPGM
jgi:Protein of unknown function (DUF3105)